MKAQLVKKLKRIKFIGFQFSLLGKNISLAFGYFLSEILDDALKFFKTVALLVSRVLGFGTKEILHIREWKPREWKLYEKPEDNYHGFWLSHKEIAQNLRGKSGGW